MATRTQIVIADAKKIYRTSGLETALEYCNLRGIGLSLKQGNYRLIQILTNEE